MSEYFKPDSRWEIFRAETLEKFLELFVFKGNFHPNVPQDVLKEYQTVEQLLACSWFYYPMYDEGFKKLLGIFEMAVKLRCKQLGIELDYKNKKGETKRRVLSQLIGLLRKREFYNSIDFDLEKARKVRNYFAHPESHSFMGSLAQFAIPQVINTINYLFLDKEPFENSLKMLEQLKTEAKQFEKVCFVFEYSGKNYLVAKVKFIESWEVNGSWIHFLFIHHISNNISEEIKNHSYTLPFYISVRDLSIANEHIEAIEISTGRPFKLYRTSKPENTERVENYYKDINENSKEEDVSIYQFYLADIMARELVKHRYRYYWNS